MLSLQSLGGFFLTSYGNKRQECTIQVLELEGLQVLDPEWIKCTFIHLRYFSLRNTSFDLFPFSGDKFPCLQTLDIRETTFKNLPNIIWTLNELRHLYLNTMEPPSLSCLTNQQTLSGALISNEKITYRCKEWISCNCRISEATWESLLLHAVQ